MNNLKALFSNALKGMAMGMAEVIPGVSGGTIAFITGIYETLIQSIKAILGTTWIKALRNEGISGAWQQINGTFVLSLLIGMGAGVVVGVFGISHLLENYPVLLWAFFFGLIIASAIYIAKQVTKWKTGEILILICGTIIAYIITVISPAEGNTALWFVFISGAIAISALILPGISGSFILLLMGMYTFIIPTVKEALKTFESKSIMILVVFGAGCLVGLATFSRVLSWMFKHYHNLTLALLTGFMLGSLNKIWPWRKPVLGIDENGNTVEILQGMEVDKILKEANLLPGQFAQEVGNPNIGGVIIVAIIGFALVFVIERVGRK